MAEAGVFSSPSSAYFMLFNLLGYGGAEDKNIEVVRKSGDNEIDGVMYQDKLGIDRISV